MKTLAAILVTALAIGAGAWAWHSRAVSSAAREAEHLASKNEAVATADVAAADASPPKKPPPALSAKERKFLWDTENVAFQLSYKTGPALGQAFVKRDVAQLAAFFARDFRGATLPVDAGEVSRRAFAEWRTVKQGKDAAQPVDAEGLAAWLARLAARFHSVPQVQLSVLSVAPEQRDRLDGPWRSVWQLRIAGERADRPPGQRTGSARGPSDEMFPAPYKASGGAPIEATLRIAVRWEKEPADFGAGRGWISRFEVEQLTVATAERTLLEDVTASCGIDADRMFDNWRRTGNDFATTPGGVYAADVNGDGWIDLLVTDRKWPALYINEGGKFVDLDNDGKVDLILGNVVYRNTGTQFVPRGT